MRGTRREPRPPKIRRNDPFVSQRPRWVRSTRPSRGRFGMQTPNSPGFALPARRGNWVRSAKIARFAARRDFQIVKERRRARPSRFIRSAGDRLIFHDFGNYLGNFRGPREQGTTESRRTQRTGKAFPRGFVTRALGFPASTISLSVLGASVVGTRISVQAARKAIGRRSKIPHSRSPPPRGWRAPARRRG